MAITDYNFNAGSYVKSGSARVITCTSTSISSNFKYRFYLELIYDSQTYSYTFRPNEDDYGIINIGKILQSIVEPISVQQVLTVPDADTTLTSNNFQQNIHSMPHFKFVGTGHREQYLSTAGSSVKRIQAKLYDFFAVNETDVPTKQGTPVTDYYYVIGGYGTSTDLINETYVDYKLLSANSLLLSPLYCKDVDSSIKEIKVGLGDYGSVSFFNTTDDVNQVTRPHNFLITYYNSAGVQLQTQELLQSVDYGGNFSTAGVTDDSMIITFGCFPANLNKLPNTYYRPVDFSTLAYYDLIVRNDADVQRTKKYRFRIVNRCKKYDTQRFAYINSFGVWEYITFHKKRTDELSSKRTEIKSSVFDYTRTYTQNSGDYKEASYVPGVAHESRVIKASDVKSKFTVNTGYLEDYEISKVKEMFLSPKINYINTDGTAIAVMLTNSSIDEVVVSHRYEQTEYKLNFEYSVPKYNPIIF